MNQRSVFDVPEKRPRKKGNKSGVGEQREAPKEKKRKNRAKTGRPATKRKKKTGMALRRIGVAPQYRKGFRARGDPTLGTFGGGKKTRVGENWSAERKWEITWLGFIQKTRKAKTVQGLGRERMGRMIPGQYISPRGPRKTKAGM